MTNQLLDPVLPQRLAKRRQVIDCTVEIQIFERLVEIVSADLAVLAESERPVNWWQTPVNIRLGFDFSASGHGIPLLVGEVSTTLIVVCQRCLESCELPLTAAMRYLLLPAGADSRDDEEEEIWELAEKTMRPIDVVEEALIMAMPFPALHESEGECGILVEEFSPTTTDMTRPFAGLKAQLEKTK
jgi:hypothetical protein